MNQDILSSLNPQQQKAVQVIHGPLLILAGAGSGKTKCLTHRTAHLMMNQIPGDQILAVTFTNKAANEMKTRIERLIPQEIGTRMPHVGTFHSTCVRILRQHIQHLNSPLTQSFVIFDTSDTQSLIKQLIKDNGFNDTEIKYKAVLSHISGAKNQLLSPHQYESQVDENRFTKAVKVLFRHYQRKLAEQNALDFDDLLQKTVELFETAPEVLKYYQQKWKYLMIDEYQDTNFAQYRFMRLLGDANRNICVIGDDHQSIYSFRGADYTNILNFEKDFPDAQIIKLEQNYRSTKNILHNANSLITQNKTGLKKTLWTDNESGDKVSVVQVSNERDEGNYVAQKIQELKHSGLSTYTDCAVLYRMNAQSRSIEESLMRHQIPYQIIGGTRFFDRKEIKDIIAYLRLIFNSKDDTSFSRILNVPLRKIGPATYETIRQEALNRNISLFEVASECSHIYDLSIPKQKTIYEFITLIESLKKIAETEPITNLIEAIIKKTNYEAHLDDGTAEGKARIQNVQELLSVANKYDSADNPLASFLEGIALIADIDNYEESDDKITLMTIHASKGLEFPVVFLPGWEQGIFPTSNADMDNAVLEEERRLAYVAITRAQKKCTIINARERMLFGRTEYANPSQFLSELDPNCIVQESTLTTGGLYSRKKPDPSTQNYEQIFNTMPKTRSEALWGVKEKTSEFKTGQRIHHKEFGEGSIILVSGDVLSVAFKGLGVKKIVGSVAPIELLS